MFTKLWWDQRRFEFEMFTSRYVVREASMGDPTAATARLAVLNEIELIELEQDIERVADALLAETALPAKAKVDAYHVAAAACNGLEFLMTWNCKHLANAHLWSKIERVCADAGFTSPRICTPYELLGDAYDPRPDR
jgi:hypothetical protein